MNRRFVYLGPSRSQEKMFGLKGILAVVMLMQKVFGQSLQYIPVSSPQLFQNYVSNSLQFMKPPTLGPIWLNIPQSAVNPLVDVDFRKQKTQTFYKSTLVPEQRPVYEFRYKVHDPMEENYQEKSETRVGDAVKGWYSVREPNGYIRLVKYVSDENGFKTQVSHHYAGDNKPDFLFRTTRNVSLKPITWLDRYKRSGRKSVDADGG